MAGLAAFTAIISIPELTLPPGFRQSELLYEGWALTQGLVPYRDFWDNGSPGVIFLYAIAVRIYHSYVSVNVLDILWRCVTTIAVYLLAKRLYGRREGILAGVLYAIVASTISSVFELNALPEGFTILPVVLGFYFYLDEKQRIGWNSLSGICFAIAAIIKLPLFLIIIAVAIHAIVTPRHTWEPRPRRAKFYSFLYGVIIVFSMLIFYLLLSWAIDDFVKEVIVFNLHR